MIQRRYLPEETKERIIQAAGEVFGQRGFSGTTIRQITERAGVNVAAVNYHFRDKSELYLRVLQEAKCRTQELTLQELSGTAEERLKAFIFAFVRQLLDSKRPRWHTQVITQEMLQPTPALDVLVREMTEPLFRQIRRLAGDVARVKLSRTQLDLLASSILSQCLFYVRSAPMIERLAPELSSGADRIEKIAGHVAAFSLAALCNLFPHNLPTSRSRALARP